MTFGKDAFRRDDALLYGVGAAAVTTLISIRVFEILMAVALVALIVTRGRWRVPPVWLPLASSCWERWCRCWHPGMAIRDTFVKACRR